MKKLIISFFILVSSLGASGQTRYIKDASGNFTAAKTSTKNSDVPTANFFIDSKGVKYSIFRGSRGGLYYNRIARSGKSYKVYLGSK